MTPRRFFQFHLVTVLVMTVVAGAFLGANVRSRVQKVESAIAYVYGWPMVVASGGVEAPSDSEPTEDEWNKWMIEVMIYTEDYGGRNLAINIATGLLIVCVAGVVCEAVVRRRAGSKSV